MSYWDRVWKRQYQSLLTFRETFPERWPNILAKSPMEQRIAAWCNSQRSVYRKGTLPKHRCVMLDALGFTWAPTESEWRYQFELLLKFREQFPARWPSKLEEYPVGSGNCLGSWCVTQRSMRRKKHLDHVRYQRLEEIGFTWEVLEEQWFAQFDILREYRDIFRDTWPATTEKFPDGNSLGAWCAAQRRQYLKHKLGDEKADLLGSIGFPWRQAEERWTTQFNYLTKYRRAHPTRWPSVSEEFPKGNKLGSWCAVQRKFKHQGGLARSRQDLLESIDFPWALFNKRNKSGHVEQSTPQDRQPTRQQHQEGL